MKISRIQKPDLEIYQNQSNVRRISNLVHKNILIASDQDADGAHIRALVLAFFHRFSPSLIKNSHVYFLKTPIICGFDKNGKIVEYFFSLSEYKDKNSGKLRYQYFKGLGSWIKEDLKIFFDQYGIENFIVVVDGSEKNDDLKNWLSSKTVDFRKDNLRSESFDINKV